MKRTTGILQTMAVLTTCGVGWATSIFAQNWSGVGEDAGNCSALVQNAPGQAIRSDAALTVLAMSTYQQFALFPLTLGSSWTYDDGGIALVSQATFNNSVLSVIITNKNTTPHGYGSLGLVADSSQVTLGSGGIGSANYIIFDGDMGYYPLVKSPMSLGQSWTSYWNANGYPAYQTETVTDTNKPVTILGNVFPNCTELTVTTSFPQGYTPGQTRWVRSYYYFLPQVGCIKRILTSDSHQTNVVQAISWDIKGSPTPVVISRQPQSQTVAAGGTATLSVAAYGAAALKYQWRLNGSNIPGATKSTCTLAKVKVGSGGDYSVMVSNVYGSLLSSNATLVVVPPVDTQPPTLAITNPANGSRLSNAVVDVKGWCKDNDRITNVMVSVGVGAFQPAVALNNGSNWVLAGQRLWPGTNLLRAQAADAAGNLSQIVTSRVSYVVRAPLNLTSVGQGTISPNYSNAVLEVGLSQSVKAAGVNGHQFRRWEVATNGLNPVVVTNPTLNFVMQSNLTLKVVFADTSRPVVTVTNLAANQRLSNTVYTVRGKATDNAAVSNVWYRLNGGPDWLAASGVAGGRTSLWSASLVLERPTNTLEVWAEDATGNRSTTNKVGFVYVKMFTLTDYFPLPLGGHWLYHGTDSQGSAAKFTFDVTDTNHVITTYIGTKPVIGYPTNCVRVSGAYLDPTTMVPYETWDDYMAPGGRVGQFGDDDLPAESMRIAGGWIAPAQMAVGASFTLKTNAYMFGTNAGMANITFQLIGHTNITVPAGSFPDVLRMRWNMVAPDGAQVHDEWWAKGVGRIKRLHLSGKSSAVSYELIQYQLPSSQLSRAKTAAPDEPSAPNLPLQIQSHDGSLAATAGGMRMKFSGSPGAVVVVESSPDLVHWSPIQTNTLSGGQMYFCDPQRTNTTQRFYRLRSP